jgi:hypothetical protein
VRPLPRYVLAIMAAFVAFELWIPLLAIVVRALVGPTVPTAVQAIIPLFGIAVPALVGLALSDYLADRRGLVRPYQPKRRATEADEDEDLNIDEEEEVDEGPEEQDVEEGELEEGELEEAREREVEDRTEVEEAPSGGGADEEGLAEDRGGNGPVRRPRRQRGR